VLGRAAGRAQVRIADVTAASSSPWTVVPVGPDDTLTWPPKRRHAIRDVLISRSWRSRQ
jgi:hypothetical protein